MSAPPQPPATCPPPPGSEDTDPPIRTYDAGTRLVRVHSAHRDGHAFTDVSQGAPLTPGRVSPFVPDGADQHVAVLCAAEDLEGAVSERVFHDVPVRGEKSVARRRLQDEVATAASWARALHGSPMAPDGLLWVSRQRDTSVCVVLLGGRVGQDDVQPVSGLVPVPLYAGDGYERVARMADDARIMLTER